VALGAPPTRGPGVSPAALVMPTRILVLGSGAREHALAWKLSGEPGVNEVVVAPGSYAIDSEPRVRGVRGFDPLDAKAVAALAKSMAAELVVIGPEAPLAAGVADALTKARIPVFGPGADGARIESSKAFCHDIAAAAGVPMARSIVDVGDGAAARSFVHALGSIGHGAVVKLDGLAAGKGVTVAGSTDEAIDAIDAALRVGPVVVEERLEGREASVIVLTDGKDVLALPAARDHKRLGDFDGGPNTGGMGGYSPVPDLSDDAVDDIVDRFHRPILRELAKRKTRFRGALFAGLMLTAAGPVLLECNARFGDPETQVIMPRLAAPLGPLLLAAAKGRLAVAVRALGIDGVRLPTLPGSCLGIVLAAAGYPEAPRRGDPIEGLFSARSTGALVFHAGTARDEDGGFRTNGGRVLTVVGRGPDLEAARQQAEAGAERISFDGLQRRRDIGFEARMLVAAGT
jgi:phosphoribosylamine---glycine ligase